MSSSRVIMVVVFVLATALSSTASDSLTFNVVNYNVDGSVSRSVEETYIKPINKLSIRYYKNNFFVPYYVPSTFINKQYKSDTVVVWSNPKDKTTSNKSSFNTYMYDEYSRLRSYSYSSCTICSNFPYTFIVTYNTQNEVVELRDRLNLKNVFRMTYDQTGNLTEVKCYSLGKLSKVITIVK